MSQFKPFRELRVETFVENDEYSDSVRHIVKDALGVEYGEFLSPEIAQRMVDCWNACRSLYSPSAHIEESAAYIKRLEGLRKEAVARVEELECAA